MGEAASIFGPVFDAIFNFGSTVYGNKVSRDRANEAVDFLNRLNEDIDAERLNWSEEQFRIPYDESRFGPEQFETSTDFGAMLERVMGEIGQGQDKLYGQSRNPLDVAREVGGFVDDVGTDKFLHDQLNEIGAASRARQGQRSQEVLARMLSSGKTLEEAQGSLDALRYGEEESRAGQIGAVEAAAEAERNKNMQYRAGLQATAHGQQTGINANLATLAAELDRAQAQVIADIGGMEYAAEDRDQTQAFDAYMTKLGLDERTKAAYIEMAKWLGGLKAGNMSQQAGIIAGTPFVIPQTTVGRDIAQNLLQEEAIGASRQSKGMTGSAGASMKGPEFGLGFCVAAGATVQTDRGPKPLAGVMPGDRVLAADGAYHEVIAKDCGTVPPEEQREMILLVTPSARITASWEHEIEGRPASEWVPGDVLTVNGRKEQIERADEVAYEPSGDLMLEGNVDYLANGFRVVSMIGRAGFEQWRARFSDPKEVTEAGNFLMKASNPMGVWVKES